MKSKLIYFPRPHPHTQINNSNLYKYEIKLLQQYFAQNTKITTMAFEKTKREVVGYDTPTPARLTIQNHMITLLPKESNDFSALKDNLFAVTQTRPNLIKFNDKLKKINEKNTAPKIKKLIKAAQTLIKRPDVSKVLFLQTDIQLTDGHKMHKTSGEKSGFDEIDYPSIFLAIFLNDKLIVIEGTILKKWALRTKDFSEDNLRYIYTIDATVIELQKKPKHLPLGWITSKTTESEIINWFGLSNNDTQEVFKKNNIQKYTKIYPMAEEVLL